MFDHTAERLQAYKLQRSGLLADRVSQKKPNNKNTSDLPLSVCVDITVSYFTCQKLNCVTGCALSVRPTGQKRLSPAEKGLLTQARLPLFLHKSEVFTLEQKQLQTRTEKKTSGSRWRSRN